MILTSSLAKASFFQYQFSFVYFLTLLILLLELAVILFSKSNLIKVKRPFCFLLQLVQRVTVRLAEYLQTDWLRRTLKLNLAIQLRK